MHQDEWNPAFCVQKNLYCDSETHMLIGVEDSPGNVSMINISENAENLTIAILSLNRAKLTKRLMQSIADKIPGFKGIFMILDNGSDPDEINQIRRFAELMPYRCQFELQEKNYGVAGGRNRIMRAAKTDWVFCLDNDMVFLGNPFPQAQIDISRLGVHFLSVPFINGNNSQSGVLGGNLFVENIDGRVNIGLGTALLPKEFRVKESAPGFLCTGIFGGASIVNRHTLLNLGGYEENMFVGFEDIEFSMRVFQAGYKAGSMAMICLSHDHEKTESSKDQEYERERFHKQRLYESAMFFEKKHGIGVWNRSAENWIDMRRRELNIQGEAVDTVRPRVALVIDIPDWALDHIADQVILHCSDSFEFCKYYTKDIDNIADLLIAVQDCDIIHFFWRGVINWYYDDSTRARIEAFGYKEEEFRKQYISTKIITTSVYDHLYLKEGESQITKKLFASTDTIVNAYTVSSEKLRDIYYRRSDIRLKPSALVPDGVDLQRFRPMNFGRFKSIGSRVVRFGWVGNSNWEWAETDLKGLHTIIVPAIEELKKQGYKVELITSDRNEKTIKHYLMPKFYAQIDCYLCASLHEGTPNPVLESMGCGVPVISTDVGLIPQLFGEKQKELVLRERSVSEMINRMKRLLDDPELFEVLSKENLESIKSWDWSICAKRFIPFWQEQIERYKR